MAGVHPSERLIMRFPPQQKLVPLVDPTDILVTGVTPVKFWTPVEAVRQGVLHLPYRENIPDNFHYKMMVKLCKFKSANTEKWLQNQRAPQLRALT